MSWKLCKRNNYMEDCPEEDPKKLFLCALGLFLFIIVLTKSRNNTTDASGANSRLLYFAYSTKKKVISIAKLSIQKLKTDNIMKRSINRLL